MLSVDGLNQSYGASHTLWDLSLDVPKGACLSLIGRNGVGKTTLLGCLMGLIRTDSGTIRFDGRDLTGTRPELRAPLGIGFVPQGRMIFPLLTVEENLRAGLPSAGRPATQSTPTARRRKVPDLVFELFPVLKSMLRRRGGDLSGGQQQQLAIGRALVLEPRLLILDEPTEGIQPNIVHEIGDAILRLNEDARMTILLVEQKLPFARRIATGFHVFEKGRAVASGAIGDLTDDVVRRHLHV